LSRIHKYSNENPDKIIIATGDTSQLQPINELSNQFEYAKYADDCINQIFKYEIYLNENKRLKSDADKEKLKQIKKDIFNKSIPLAETIKKYFKFTTNITNSEHNIAYMNDTCKTVSKHIRKLKNKEADYEVGEMLICREYCKTKEYHFSVNFEYVIVGVKPNHIIIKCVSSNEEFVVPIKIINSNFIFSYCGTCHSQQGSSIDSTITIFDYKSFFVTAEWLWVAITRATELDNVYFYD
jgi:ATP-dependent exoDNAse (exonuclease V) alpha subunit